MNPNSASASLDPTQIMTGPGFRAYHLDLIGEEVADTVLTVGDPDRIDQLLPHFASVDLERRKREFRTVTGTIRGHKVTVLSTGMGSDNVDIALNELELVANWDLEKRLPNKLRRSLQIIRLGTSGALQEDLGIDRLLVSTAACSMDSLHHFYPQAEADGLNVALQEFTNRYRFPRLLPFYPDKTVSQRLISSGMEQGITYTACGFYGPQGRKIWEGATQDQMLDRLSAFRSGEDRITNVEMETAALFHLGSVFGHKMASVSALLANRASGQTSSDPEKTVKRLIDQSLDVLF